MADFPPFAFTTQESWYGELSFKAAEDGSPVPLAGRQFEMHITPASSGAQLVPPVTILTMEEGRGLSLKQGDPSTLIFRVPRTTANTFARGEYTGDVLEVVGGERYLFMPVRITYAEPSGLRAFLTRFLGVSVSFAARQQPIYTPLAVPGREGRPGATILRGIVPPVPADGKDSDYYIEDRTASGQGRRMWGPKAGGAWPGTPWVIQVAAYPDVPGLTDALSETAVRFSTIADAQAAPVPDYVKTIQVFGADYVLTQTPAAGAFTITRGTRQYVLSVDRPSVQHFGGLEGGGDIAPAIAFARAHLGSGARLRLPRTDAGSYYLGSLPAGAADLIYDPDPGVVIRTPANPPANLRFTRPVTWRMEGQNFDTVLSPRLFEIPCQKSLWLDPGTPDLSRLTSIDCVADMQVLKVAWPTGDDFVPDAAGGNPAYVGYPTFSADGFMHCALVKAPRHGDQITFNLMPGGTALGDTVMGAMMRCTGGYAMVYAFADNSAYFVIKPVGQPLEQVQAAWAGQQTPGYQAQRSEWTIQVGPTACAVALNGIVVQHVPLDGLGMLIDCGSALYAPTSGSRSLYVDGWTRKRKGAALPLSLITTGIVGDSRSDDRVYTFHASWPSAYVRALDGTGGLRHPYDAVDNRAVAGENARQQLTRLQAVGWPQTYAFIAYIGTNDIQAQTNLAAFEADLRAILGGSSSPIKVVVVPALFYDIADSGQATSNGGLGAGYRARIRRVCADLGVHVVDEALIYGILDPANAARDPGSFDPIYRDDIHQTAYAHMLLGRAVAAKVMSAILAPPALGTPWRALPATALAAGTSFGNATEYRILDTGEIDIDGRLAVASAVNGQTVLTLPPILRPSRYARFFDLPTGSQAGIVRGVVDTDGTLKLYNLPGTVTNLDLGLDPILYVAD